MKKLLITLTLAASILVAPSVVKAEEELCTQVYGGGVVCGASTHESVDTDLDINFVLLGTGLIATSIVLSRMTRNKVKKTSLIV